MPRWLTGTGPTGPFSPKHSSFFTGSTLRAFEDDDSGWQTPGSGEGSAKGSAMVGGAGVSNAGEPPFEIRGFSLGNLVILLGTIVTFGSFAGYLSGDADGGVSGLGFVYGLPIFLAGSALKYAEIEPVECITSPGAEGLMEVQGTEILQKIKKDVTRHRYGDEAHLDTTVKRLGLVIKGNSYPQLKEVREGVSPEGKLIFTMVWESLETPFKMWDDADRKARYPGCELTAAKRRYLPSLSQINHMYVGLCIIIAINYQQPSPLLLTLTFVSIS